MSDKLKEKMAGILIGACGAATLVIAVATVTPTVPAVINGLIGVGGALIGVAGLLMIKGARQKD